MNAVAQSIHFAPASQHSAIETITPEIAASKMNRNDYGQWKKNEANAKRIAESYKEKK